MRSNQKIYETPQFEILSENQRERIYSAALEVLEHTGVKIQGEKALSLLKEAGASADGEIVYIPSYLVENALRSTPKKVLIYTRDGNLAMRLEGFNSYFGTGSDCPSILDSFTGERRKFTKRDVEQAAVICDTLPNIDFMMSMGLISDKPTVVTDIHQFQAMVFNTKKPIVFTSLTIPGAEDIIKMAGIIAGSEEELRRKPFIIHYIEPSSPLAVSKEAVDRLLLSADKGIPVVFTPGPMAGATSPATLAGTLVTALAESLSGIVLSQLKREGLPLIVGGTSGIMDMRTAITPYGGPEFYLLNAAMSELCRFIGVPMFGTAGCSDAKKFGEQAAIESSLSVITQVLSGANLIHDIGYLESGLTGSFDMLVLTDEIIAMAKRFMRGINTDDERLALQVIDKVGPGGNYLVEDHTLKYFKEYWEPKLIDRQNYKRWSDKGSKSLGERVNEKVKSILAEYKTEPLEDKKQREVLKIIEFRERKI
ncbi:trimethylamine methyltransferase family protein [Candidatus Aerophobetes bacterium]|nr:trimethylamine methyltransferase family protein [Candidatus Aerophobetes bacterium]